VSGIAQMISGKGVTSDNAQANSKLNEWDINNQLPLIAFDLKLHGGYYLELIKTLDGSQIAKVNHLPFENCRLSYSAETGKVNGVWYSKNWSDTRKARNKPVCMPLFEEIGSDHSSGVIYSFIPTAGTQYYPKPDYIGGMHYIEMARQIAIYHLNNIENGLFPSFIIQFNNGQPDTEKGMVMKRTIEESISGAKNAGKFIMLFNDSQEQAASFEAFPISDADKQYIFLSEESDKKIFVSHRVTTPLLFGIRDSGGLGSNKDEMLQGLEIFMEKVVDPMRNLISRDLREVLKLSNIDAQVTFIQDATETAASTTLIEEKKKICCSHEGQILSTELEAKLIEKFSTIGEQIDADEWELVDEQAAHDTHEDELNAVKGWAQTQLADESSYANGDKKSDEDSGLYKLRYAYGGEASADSREFCKTMVSLTAQGLVFRYEDIEAMGKEKVNGKFAPEGQKSYDIFEWKGGVYCHHFWKRQIYFRKREGGKFLPNDGLKNDKRVGNVPYVKKKGFESVKPIDTPTRGSLKYS